MARTNDVTIRLLADVTKLKTGFSGAGSSIKQLSSRVQELTNGKIKLTKAGRFYDTQQKRLISNWRAESQIAAGLTREHSRQASAIKSVSSAINASVLEIQKKVQAEKTLSQVSKETISQLMQSGNAVQQLTARMVALTQGQFLLTQSGKILNATTKEEATLKQVAAAATRRLAEENEALRLAYEQATIGMGAGEKQTLNASMAMQGMAHATGSASFAVISMGQIFQDMGQFGMGAAQGVRAVTNNVQQTVQAFVMLSAMTNGADKALKQMITTLKGPVGFLAVFSLVTGLIELFANKMQQAENKVNSLRGAMGGMLQAVSETGEKVSAPSLNIMAVDLPAAIRRARGRIEQLNRAIEAQGNALRFTAIKEDGVYKATIRRKESVKILKEQLKEQEAILSALEKEKEAVDELERGKSLLFNALSEEFRAVGIALAVAANALRTAEAAKAAATNVDLESGDLDLGEALPTWATNFSDGMSDAKDNVSQLREDLKRLSGWEGLRLSTLESQAEELEEQIRWRKHLNDLERRGVKTAGVGEVGLTPRVAGALDRDPSLFGIMGGTDMAVAIRESGEQLDKEMKKHTKNWERHVSEVEKANERLKNTMANVAADIVVASMAIGSGMDGLTRMLGRMMDKYGRVLMRMGMETKIVAKALLFVKKAFESLNPGLALAGGVALVAAGARMRAAGKRAGSSMGGGGGSASGGGTFAAPNVFGSATNINAPVFSSPAYLTPNNVITVEVQGNLRGSDIYLSGSRELRSRNRMGVG